MTIPEETYQTIYSVIGKSLDEGISIIEAHGLIYRLVCQDDRYFPCTRDYKTNRINLYTKNGIITDASIG